MADALPVVAFTLLFQIFQLNVVNQICSIKYMHKMYCNLVTVLHPNHVYYVAGFKVYLFSGAFR